MTLLADQLIEFYTNLQPPVLLPAGVGVLHPQKDPAVIKVIKQFYRKFYADKKPRKLLLGINPGRYGAGITGINFTAPRQLKENCGIDHPFGNSSELSAEFIYELIEHYGGPAMFYKDHFIGSVSPLGYTQDGINLNYYANRSLQKAVTPFIQDCLDRQLSFGTDKTHCICIGGEKNFNFLNALNEQRRRDGLLHIDTITPLPHPRFILQYRRKEKEKYIQQYLDALRSGS
jgi:hypothetical protein